MDILVVGSVALDSIKTPYVQGDHILGGSAVHFANAASHLSKSIHMVGVVGEDFSKEHIDFLKNKNVDLKGLIHEKGLTFHWEGYYENDMNQAVTVKTDLNVFADFNPVIPEEYKKDKIVFLANIDPVLQVRVLDQMKKPEMIICDTMNFWIQSKKEDLIKVIERVDVAVFNDSEIRQLTGIKNIMDAARSIIKMGPSCIIVKRGEYGFLLITKKKVFAGPAMVLDDVKDPTGAGDSFAGGFVSYLAHKKKFDFETMKKAVIYANIIASFKVQGLGVAALDKVKKKTFKRGSKSTNG